MSTESRVGLFFFLGIVILGVVTFRVEDLGKIMTRTYSVKAHFSCANGLEVGNDVTLAGVKVGTVRSVGLSGEGDGVDVLMEVEQGAVIKKDSRATITLGGFVGEKYVEITLGSKGAAPLGNGDEVLVNNPLDLNAVVADAVNAIHSLADFSASLAEGKDFLKSLKEAGPKLNQTLDSVQEIAAKIKAGEGTVGKLIKDDDIYKKADAIATSLRDASERLAKIIGDNEEEIRNALAALKDTGPEIKAAVASFKEIAKKIQAGEGTVGKLVNDPKIYDDLAATLEGVRKLVAKVEKGDSALARFVNDEKFFTDTRESIAALKSVAAKIDQGQGTVGKLINDPTLFDEMKKVVQEGREAVRGAKEQIPVGAFTSVVFGAF